MAAWDYTRLAYCNNIYNNYRKNIHGVMFESIQRMASRYDRQVTLEKILKSVEREEGSQYQNIQKENQGQPADGEKKEEKR